MKFVEFEDKNINLEHVSSITILKNKIALDMDCVAEVKDNQGQKMISYYVYCSKQFNVTENEYVKNNFIEYNGINHIYINLDHISVIKYIKDKNRIIVNLSHSTTSAGYGREMRMTSKFIYCDFNSSDEFEDFKYYINNKIKEQK